MRESEKSEKPAVRSESGPRSPGERLDDSDPCIVGLANRGVALFVATEKEGVWGTGGHAEGNYLSAMIAAAFLNIVVVA